MDVVVIILVLGALAVLIFKRFGSFVYYVAFECYIVKTFFKKK